VQLFIEGAADAKPGPTVLHQLLDDFHERHNSITATISQLQVH
jgi:hypothetical protein